MENQLLSSVLCSNFWRIIQHYYGTVGNPISNTVAILSTISRANNLFDDICRDAKIFANDMPGWAYSVFIAWLVTRLTEDVLYF